MRKVWTMVSMAIDGIAEFLEEASPEFAEARA